MVARIVVVFAIVSLVGACSLGALDGFSGAPEAIDGGGSVKDASAEAASDSGGGSGGDGGGGTDANVDPFGITFEDTFESGALCAPWNVFRANASLAPPAHSGSTSCNLCTTQAGQTGGITRIVRPKSPATTLPAGSYRLTAWVQAPSYTGSIVYELYQLTMSGTKGTFVKGSGAGTSLSSQWAPLQFEYIANAPVPGWWIDLYVDNGPPVGSCFNVDDASVTYTP